jgi:hypothetical protein
MANYEEIYRHERTLDLLIETDLKIELDKYVVFERLNSEKITPHFMNIFRGAVGENSDLGNICDDNGVEFLTEKSREEFITNTFADVYKKNRTDPDTGMVIENLPDLPENCISEFLGDVSEHPSVINSKLTNEEKNNLDRELTINEFDMAVKDIKTKSSPGLDGVSNKFIKKILVLFPGTVI